MGVRKLSCLVGDSRATVSTAYSTRRTALSPKLVFRYKRERRPRYFRVVGPLYSQDAIEKPIPLGTLLTATGEYGRSGNRYYVRLTRQIPAKRGPVALEEWVLTRDLMNPTLAKPCDKRCVLRRKAESTQAALRAIVNSALLWK